jgi:Ca2+-binding RTX toxin-like protein
VNGIHVGIARARWGVLGLACLLAATLFCVPSARASHATLSKVRGKATLSITGEKREENSVYVVVDETDRSHFTVKDTGQDGVNYEENVLTFDSSIPGCQVENYVTYEPDPADDFLHCEVGAVKAIKANLGDQDDAIWMGDDIRAWTAPKIPVSVKFGAGNDTLQGGPRNDVAIGGPGKDILTGYKGNDKLVGGPGSDVLSGDTDYSFDPKPGGGNDIMIGGGARDYIHPGSGRDKVLAGGGNDIVGSAVDKDRDVLNCGAGRSDSLLGANSRRTRLKEKSVVGCETVSSGGLTSDRIWTCRKARCILTKRQLDRVGFDRPRWGGTGR